MPKQTTEKSQYEKFKEAARKLGTDESDAAFEDALRAVAKAPPGKGKQSKKPAK